MDTEQVLDVNGLRRCLPEMGDMYRHAHPYPHVVLDDLLDDACLAAANAEFPSVDASISTDWAAHVDERRSASTQIGTWGPTLQAIARQLMSDDFLVFLSELSGIQNLLAHRVAAGCRLRQPVSSGVHSEAAVTRHQAQDTWRRRINLLLLFNEDWQPPCGGGLHRQDLGRNTVAPVSNRVMIFNTTDDVCIDHPQLMTFATGVGRTMAFSYFTNDAAPSCRRRPAGRVRDEEP